MTNSNLPPGPNVLLRSPHYFDAELRFRRGGIPEEVADFFRQAPRLYIGRNRPDAQKLIGRRPQLPGHQDQHVERRLSLAVFDCRQILNRDTQPVGQPGLFHGIEFAEALDVCPESGKVNEHPPHSGFWRR